MPVKFPLTKITDSQKYGYLYKLQEALRLKHDQKAREYKEGSINKEEWQNWVDNWYDPRSILIEDMITSYRKLIKIKNKNDNPQDVKLDEVLIL